MNPPDRARAADKRITGPVEAMAQAVAQRAADVAMQLLDVTALLDKIDPNVLLEHVDVNDLLDRIEINRLLDRVDITRLVGRIDVDSLAEQTDFGAIMTKSSGTFAAGALDLMRSQAVSLDDFFARLVDWFRRRSYAGPPGPPSLPAGRRAGP